MDSNVSITKFIIKEKSLYVKCTWKCNDDDLFHIKIFDSHDCWSGNFSKETAKKNYDRCQETEIEYVTQIKKYLKEATYEDVTYDFVVNRENSELAEFTWKKRFEGSQGSSLLVHGSVVVNLDKSVESKDLLLDLVIEENKELKSKLESLNCKYDSITMELNQCKAELEKSADIKTEVEASLYGKFVQLLNAKKRRIQVLESNVHKFSDANDLGGDHS